MTTPSITALRKTFFEAFISYVVEEPYKDLVEGNPSLDKVTVLKKKQKIKDFFKLMGQIRRENYDVVIDFHGGPRASLITLLSGAKLKIGYRIKYRNFIYDIKLPRAVKSGHIHSVENHLNLVKALGVNIATSPPLFLPQARPEEIKKVRKFIEEYKLEGHKIVTIHISAGNEFRNWGADNIVKLSELLGQLPKVQIILIGTNEDQRAEEEILKKSKTHLLSLVGKLNLRELRELICRSSLFVGTDSGPMHIAASTATPMVALFGPTLPAHFSPWQAKASLIEKDFDCRPCKQRRCIYKDFRCLQTITPEEVFQACLRFL
jgi:lipopolysaccharide heptosyltransferase II